MEEESPGSLDEFPLDYSVWEIVYHMYFYFV